jgi:hypothetical protein
MEGEFSGSLVWLVQLKQCHDFREPAIHGRILSGDLSKFEPGFEDFIKVKILVLSKDEF